MYLDGSYMKFFSDLLLPLALIYYYVAYADQKLADYDDYENKTIGSVYLQDMINNGEYEKVNQIFHD